MGKPAADRAVSRDLDVPLGSTALDTREALEGRAGEVVFRVFCTSPLAAGTGSAVAADLVAFGLAESVRGVDAGGGAAGVVPRVAARLARANELGELRATCIDLGRATVEHRGNGGRDRGARRGGRGRRDGAPSGGRGTGARSVRELHLAATGDDGGGGENVGEDSCNATHAAPKSTRRAEAETLEVSEIWRSCAGCPVPGWAGCLVGWRRTSLLGAVAGRRHRLPWPALVVARYAT